ncbi:MULTISPECIES: UvrB/UvrC motif-containing protein [Planococcus]|uniref:Nucleotide excision repair protein n=1 Tax=Planococcus kocurii TaxID=1374 RepID=A0ABN4K0F0_9BACL|nr:MULTISPECIES: UvrB/UvrC motif-containing protein [Planococcus]ALS80138.1 nucleotide excision repair protein [Planococcus kocurii]KAA0954909.1 nucleotide excision repair protein [Planococcus sp. ANT_H30]MDJ0332793.1 UvrB/UvrC motif-containing protein [Planococcus sp. S3-L1]
MICTQCGERSASVIVKKQQLGQVMELQLCHICAAENHSINIAFEQDPLAIHQLLSNWFPNSQATISRPKKEVAICPSCGFTFSHFLKLGKFGCASCYDTFSSQLNEIFKRFHNGNTEHTGKIPASYGSTLKIKKEIEKLRKQMQVSIQEEEFEEAARLRDEVKRLNVTLEGGSPDGS